MATLSTLQRAQLRLYLGWSARFRQSDSRLEQSMNAIDQLSSTDPDTFALITNALGASPPGLLASLGDIDSRLTAALQRVQAKRVGSIDLPGSDEVGVLRSEGRRYAGRLAALLGVEVRQDVFSGSGPRAFASAAGMLSASGRSNYPPQG